MRLREKKNPSWDEIKENNKQNMAKDKEKLKPKREIEVKKSLSQIYLLLLLLLLLFVVKSEVKRWANEVKEHTHTHTHTHTQKDPSWDEIRENDKQNIAK